MTEVKTNFTEQQKDYYRNQIIIRKIDNQWIVHCKKCQNPLSTFEKDMDKDRMDGLLEGHYCLINKKDG